MQGRPNANQRPGRVRRDPRARSGRREQSPLDRAGCGAHDAIVVRDVSALCGSPRLTEVWLSGYPRPSGRTRTNRSPATDASFAFDRTVRVCAAPARAPVRALHPSACAMPRPAARERINQLRLMHRSRWTEPFACDLLRRAPLRPRAAPSACALPRRGVRRPAARERIAQLRLMHHSRSTEQFACELLRRVEQNRPRRHCSVRALPRPRARCPVRCALPSGRTRTNHSIATDASFAFDRTVRV